MHPNVYRLWLTLCDSLTALQKSKFEGEVNGIVKSAKFSGNIEQIQLYFLEICTIVTRDTIYQH